MGQTGDMTLIYSPETLDFIQQSMNYLAPVSYTHLTLPTTPYV